MLLILIKVVLLALVGLIVLLGIILALPFHYQLATGFSSDEWFIRSKTRWAWGVVTLDSLTENGVSKVHLKLLGRPIQLGRRKLKMSSKSTSESQKQASQPSQQPSASSKAQHPLASVRRYLNRPILKTTRRLLERLYHALHLEAIVVRGQYGFEDPTRTGLVAAWGSTVGGALPWLRWRMQPDFTQSLLNIEVDLRGWLSPEILLIYAMEFGLSQAIRPLWLGLIFKKKTHEDQKGRAADVTQRVHGNPDERSKQNDVFGKRYRGANLRRGDDHYSSGDRLIWLRNRRRRGQRRENG